MVFNTDASQLQTYRKNKNQFFIENVFPREMQLSLITASFTLIRDANLLKKTILIRNDFANLQRNKKLQNKCLKNNFSLF